MSQAKVMTKAVVTSTVATGVFLAVPHLADAALGEQTLKKGMSHPDVKELQEVLRVAGHFTYNESTGNFGTMTEEAVRSFQKQHGLVVDGIVGPQTFERLLNQEQATLRVAKLDAQQPKQTIQGTVLRVGTSSAMVSALQQMLQAEGYFNHEITGYYGRVTASAVRNYQRQNGLVVDGIAGPQTLAMLEGTTQAPTPMKSPQMQAILGLKAGDRGEKVTQLQQQLKQLGYFKAEPTGYYGKITEEAVRAFQTEEDILVSGIADEFTMNLIEQLATYSAAEFVEFQVLNLIADASNLIGTPYAWSGGTPEEGFDCSGFLNYVFAKNGKQLPRTVAEMWEVGIEQEEPRVGDLVFFETYAEGASHAGIYIGNNQFVHSGTSTGVTVSSIEMSYWNDRYLGAKRF